MKIAKHLFMLNMSNHATSTTHRIRHLIGCSSVLLIWSGILEMVAIICIFKYEWTLSIYGCSHLISWSGYLRCSNDQTSSGMQSSEEKYRAQKSIIYERTVLWNLNEENEAEKDIFLVDGAPWYLLAFGQKRHECIALQCVSATKVKVLSSTSTSSLSLVSSSSSPRSPSSY